MQIAGSILMMLLILSLLTVVHEWGHYIAARIFKVRVNEFSIFMGPKIFSHVGKKTGTLFSLRCLPIGGFCAMEGEDTTDDSDNSFSNKPWYVRAIILVAGVLMNFLLAIIIITFMNLFAGYDTRQVSVVNEQYPVAMTQIAVGDEIIAYNDDGITTPIDYTLYTYVRETADVYFTVRKTDGTKIRYLFARSFDTVANPDDEENPGHIKTDIEIYDVSNDERVLIGTYSSYWDNNRTLTIEQKFADGASKTFFYGARDGVYGIYSTSVSSSGEVTENVRTNLYEGMSDEDYIQYQVSSFNTSEQFKKFGFSFTYNEKGNILQCIGNAFMYAFSLIKSVLLSLWWLITGQLSMDALAGPIGITSLVNDVVSAPVQTSLKVLTMADMTALISANLAVFNLLPVPGLDGGKLLFILIEIIRGGKKISPEKEGIVSLIFFGLLILLAVVVAGNDIIRLISG